MHQIDLQTLSAGCQLLSNSQQKEFTDRVPADVRALVSQCPDKDAELKKTSHLVVSASLDGPQASFALHRLGGKPQVTDGPYAEAKEMVGGFFIIEAADRDEAMRVASLHPAAALGEGVGWAIEIRPIGFFEQSSGRLVLASGGWLKWRLQTTVSVLRAMRRMGRWVGNGPEIWLRMQGQYDLWLARKKGMPKVKKAKRPTVAFSLPA